MMQVNNPRSLVDSRFEGATEENQPHSTTATREASCAVFSITHNWKQFSAYRTCGARPGCWYSACSDRSAWKFCRITTSCLFFLNIDYNWQSRTRILDGSFFLHSNYIHNCFLDDNCLHLLILYCQQLYFPSNGRITI